MSARRRFHSALHTHDLPQRVHDVDEVRLGRHHRVDVLVRHRRLVDHVGVLAALDVRRRAPVILDRELRLRFRARQSSARTV